MKPWYTNRLKKVVQDHNIVESIEVLLKEDLYSETKEFLISLKEYFKSRGGLTIKQHAALKEVEKSLEPEVKAARKLWNDSYDENKKEIAKICALYYKENPPYFSDLSKKVLENSGDYILPEKAYNAMCKNDYARRILAATFDEPKYNIWRVGGLSRKCQKTKRYI